MSHTPGPWKFDERSAEVGPISDLDDQTFGMVLQLCDVYGDNKKADGHLISAAPDLLAALKLCDEAMTWEIGGEPLGTLMLEARNKARAAIAKARGE